MAGGGSELGEVGASQAPPSQSRHLAVSPAGAPAPGGSGGREEHRESILMLPELLVRPLPLLAHCGEGYSVARVWGRDLSTCWLTRVQGPSLGAQG